MVSPCVGSPTCSQGALFTQDIKCLPVPQQGLGSSLWMVQPTGCLGLGQLQHDFGGEIAVSRGKKAGRGPRGTQRRRGNTSWQRAEPTGVADGPRPPPARLGRHKCVSLRVPDCRGITSRENTPGCHSNITSWDVPCCAVIQQPARGPRGWRGCSAAPEEDEGPTQPLGPRDAILLPRSSDLCSSTALTVIFFNLNSSLILLLGRALLFISLCFIPCTAFIEA